MAKRFLAVLCLSLGLSAVARADGGFPVLGGARQAGGMSYVAPSTPPASSVGTNQLTDGSVALVDLNTADVDTRYLTTGTAQTVSGAKTFSGAVVLSGGLYGEIKMYVSASTPTYWMVCHGQSLSTTTYANLYNVIGYSYGGAGANFSLPDLRGRAPIGAGTDSESVAWTVGTSTGSSTLDTSQMPAHTHAETTYENVAAFGNAARIALASATGSLASIATGSTGGGNRHRPLELVVNYIIYTGQ